MADDGPTALSPIATRLGWASIVPFLVCAVILLTAPEPPVRNVVQRVLAGYGAVMLVLLAGTHCALALHGAAVRAGRRIAYGVLPALAGIASVFFAFDRTMVVQVAAFGGLWLYEHRVLGAALLPAPYLALRRRQTLLIVAALGLALMSRTLAPPRL